MKTSKKEKDPIQNYKNFVAQFKKNYRLLKYRYVLGIGSNGDLLSKSIAADLNLKILNENDLLFYKVEEVLVVSDEFSEEIYLYEKFGYQTFVYN